MNNLEKARAQAFNAWVRMVIGRTTIELNTEFQNILGPERYTALTKSHLGESVPREVVENSMMSTADEALQNRFTTIFCAWSGNFGRA